MELREELDEFRAFRHFFIHGYGTRLSEEHLMPLARKIRTTWMRFEKEFSRSMLTVQKNSTK